MVKKMSHRNQTMYKMKGCSKTRKYKKYLGGDGNIYLAYPSNHIPIVPNPYVAYTGKGGGGSTIANSSCSPSPLASPPENTNGIHPAYPSTGPVATGYNFLNPQTTQKGGKCNCGMFGGKRKKHNKTKKGGMCPMCTMGFMVGGSSNHRIGCKCSSCKMNMYGGNGNHGIPYPNGLVGTPWKPEISNWPGVNGINGDSNYIALNQYTPTDISREMIDVGANSPYITGGKHRHLKKQKGGTLSNFLGQDLVNLGRQFQFGLGSAYNALAGYPAPVNPMPWKGQMTHTPSLSAIKTNFT
jgi:hypothetical protein